MSVKDDIAIDIYKITSSDAEEEPDLEPAWQLRITDADEEGIHAQTLEYDPDGDWITDFEYVNDMLVAKTYNGLSLVGFIYDEFDGHNDDPPVTDFYLFDQGCNDPVNAIQFSMLQNSDTISVVDEGHVDAQGVVTATLGDSDEQVWIVEKVPFDDNSVIHGCDQIKLRNKLSGLYLSVENRNAVLRTDMGDNSTWLVWADYPGWYTGHGLYADLYLLQNKALPQFRVSGTLKNQYLDINNGDKLGRPLNLWQGNGGWNQRFALEEYNEIPPNEEDEEPPLVDGGYYAFCNLYNNFAIESNAAATAAGTQIIVWNGQRDVNSTVWESVMDSGENSHRYWKAELVTSPNIYRFHLAKDETKSLSAHGSSQSICTLESYLDDHTLWKVTKSAVGQIQFESVYMEGYVIGHSGGTQASGTKLDIYPPIGGSGSNNQWWSPVRMDVDIPIGEYKLRTAGIINDYTSYAIVPITEQEAMLGNRMAITMAANTEWGATICADPCVFYVDKPWAIWTYDDYIDIVGHTSSIFGLGPKWIKSVDLYFTVDDAQEYIWAYRYEFPKDELVEHQYPYTGGNFSFRFDWTAGDASMWSSVPLRPSNQNYTSGPLARYVQILDNRLWYWGSPTVNRERIWIGGNIGNQLTCNPYLGGGWVDCESGHGNRVEAVTKYKTQSGNDIITALVSNPNTGKDLRFNMVETNVSLSQEQTLRTWQAEQVAGAIGVRGHMGTVVCQDGLYTVSTYGVALTTLTMEYNSQIVANYVSDAIKPAFTDFTAEQLRYAQMLHIDGILYLWLPETELLFCYDIGLKAWWTVELPSDITKEQVRHLVSVDFEGEREGLGLVSDTGIYVMGTTMDFGHRELLLEHDVHIESGELGTKQPIQAWQHVTQFEFNFDYFMGECWIDVIGIDRFGRTIVTTKHVDTWVGNETGPKMYSCIYKHTVYMRVDETFESYKIRIRSFNEVQDAEDRLHVDHVRLPVNFRLTHFQAKIYPKSSKIGIMYGFDDRQSFTRNHMFPQTGDIHPIFRNYEDIRKAVLP